MRCPGCGAAPTAAMVEEGECGYCGAALPESEARQLREVVEKLAEAPPKVVHVTKVEVKAPDVGRVIDSVGARVAGCGTGCVSMLTTLIISLVIIGVVAFNIWNAQRHVNTPTPAPSVEQPAPGPAPAPGRKPHKRR